MRRNPGGELDEVIFHCFSILIIFQSFGILNETVLFVHRREAGTGHPDFSGKGTKTSAKCKREKGGSMQWKGSVIELIRGWKVDPFR